MAKFRVTSRVRVRSGKFKDCKGTVFSAVSGRCGVRLDGQDRVQKFTEDELEAA